MAELRIEREKYEAYVREYEKKRMPEEVERYILAQEEREEFLKRFPISRIRGLSLEEYAFKKSGNSFSSIMYSRLQNIAHTGNIRTNMYGIYFKEGNHLALSPTYEKIFGNDYERAFAQVKEDIAELLTEVQRNNFEAIENCRLHMSFKYKLLAVYFPEKFLPVCTRTMMEAICNTMGVSFGDREMVYSNIELRKIKESSSLTKDWNNGVFLGFCRWIGDTYPMPDKRKIDVSFAEKIDGEVDGLHLQGEERNAVVKIRVNQGIFREELLKRYGKCVLCGVTKRELLIASHIKPWKDSGPEEKVDVDNGLLFCPNHDKLFDKGLISFSDKGALIISKSLDEINSIYTNVRHGMTIELTEGNEKYLSFHRNRVFKE